MTKDSSSNSIADLPINHMLETKKSGGKIGWYYAPAYILFWFVLFIAVVVPVFFHLPEGRRISEERPNDGKFIAERAERMLVDFEMIGPKVVGSFANENLTVEFLYNEIDKIRQVMHADLFEMEVDLQVVSGAYTHWTMINMYQGLQNFVVKFNAKTSTSQTYLLINSHFDTKPGSPGSGDDGTMVVIMLEILRVLATTRETFEHPMIFLFNGAEENPLQASHGFVTQHKWAKNCKALINLDSAGSGNKEILFQSGPNHPWLMKYYSKNVKRPYATSVAEELFQANIIPSDTDFRIFRDYGHIPGLDLAHSYNGYVYHTKFDKLDVIPRGTLQQTGENILGLAKALANAPEMRDTEKYSEGHSVFYDYMGLFLVYYTETDGQIINTCVAVAVLLATGISLWRMAKVTDNSILNILKKCSIILLLHIVGIVLALGLPILLAVIYDSGDRSMTWFTNKWLVFGLYVAPALLGLCLPTSMYIKYYKRDDLKRSFKIEMIMHSHAIVLAIISIITTFMGLRSSYIFMISLFFYGISLVLNLLTTLHYRDNFSFILTILCQILPFLYTAYIFFALASTLMPMMGRFGTGLNPDLLIGGLCALAVILAMGFVFPIINSFRQITFILLSLIVITFIFAMMSISHLGFPYRARTNVGRVNFLHVRRVFYDFNGMERYNDTGYFFDFQDRRIHYPIKESIDLSEMTSVQSACDDYMMCGIPLFNHRWYKTRNKGQWLPSSDAIHFDTIPNLTILNKTVNAQERKIKMEFEMSGTPHMSIFLQPLEGVKVIDWSFMKTMLEKPEDFPPPYHIYFTYGKVSTPLKFYVTFELQQIDDSKPFFEIGISAHYVSYDFTRSQDSLKFLEKFPDYIHVMEWPSFYKHYLL